MARSPLEWLGFEMALRRFFLMEPACAQITTELARSKRPLPSDYLIANCDVKDDKNLRTLVSRIRKVFEDLGLRAFVVCADGSYTLTRGGAAELWGRVLEDLKQHDPLARPGL